MQKTLVIITLCLFSATGSAMTWTELKQEIDSVESGNPPNVSIISRMSDIVTMMTVLINAQADHDPSSLLFCPPKNQSVTLDQIVSLIRHQARISEPEAAASVQQLLMDSMRREFPCSENDG